MKKNKGKKILSLGLSALLLTGTLPAMAAETGEDLAAEPALVAANGSAGNLPVTVDGETADFSACVVVPLRAAAEKLGFTVLWNGQDRSIRLDDGSRYATVTLGNPVYQVAAGVAGAADSLSMAVAPYAVGGTTYVSLELFRSLLDSGDVTLEDGEIRITTENNSSQISNPIQTCEDLAQAAQLVGFTLTVPGEPQTVSVLDSYMIQAFYEDGACIRKAAGTGDISGDYNTYEKIVTEDGITLKGNGETFSLALWSRDGYSYAVSVEKAVSRAELLALAAQVK